MNGTGNRVYLWLVFSAITLGCAPSPPLVPEWSGPPVLDVVYPRAEGSGAAISLARVDSTFLFGSVKPPNSQLWINDFSIQVWPNGAFLAFIPLIEGASSFKFVALSPHGDTSRSEARYFLPPLKSEAPNQATHPLNKNLPARITIIEDYAALRSAPGQAYTLFPPRGSVALADSFASGCFRVRLTEGRYAWVEEKFVELDVSSRTLPVVSIRKIAVQAGDPWTTVRIPLAQPILFDLSESPENRSLILDLYGSTAWVNRMDYDPADSTVREIRWNQIGNETVRLEFLLNVSRLWGYNVAWQINSTEETYTLTLSIRRPPHIERRPLKGRVIVLDPGHGGSQPGAVGPTRLAEKEPNLKLALKLKQLLEKEGATVYLTRSTDSTVDLYDRVRFAVAAGAEVLVSLHNNALSDGENPFLQHGSGAYYYHPHSLDLARSLHLQLIRQTGLRDNGLYYQNLALCRPPEMPAVLIETAFMMHPDEENLLRDNRFLDRAARGLRDGLYDYFSQCHKEIIN